MSEEIFKIHEDVEVSLGCEEMRKLAREDLPNAYDDEPKLAGVSPYSSPKGISPALSFNGNNEVELIKPWEGSG
jgi:hypothetical protein